MKITVHQSNSDGFSIKNFDDATVMDLIDEFTHGDSEVLMFELDGNQVYVTRAHIVRIDVDHGSDE